MRRVIFTCAGLAAGLAALVSAMARKGAPDFSHLPPLLRPFRPPAVAVINAAGGMLLRVGLFDLPTEEAAIEAACKAAKLPSGARCSLDLPDEPAAEWRDGLRALLASYRADANLTALGRLIAAGQLEQWLKSRARLVHAWGQLPRGALAAQPIERPLFIVGLPRTGTTFLLNLLMQDPALRAPLHWELVEPLPGVQRKDVNLAVSCNTR